MLTYHLGSVCIMQHCITQALLFVAMAAAAELINGEPQFQPSDTKIHDIIMKGAKPKQADTYLCTGYPLSEEKEYIVKFETLTSGTAHHMILFGCSGEPYSKDPFWVCGSKCSEGLQTMIFAPQKNASFTVLPEGVGFRIGNESKIRSLVLEVHYAKAFKEADGPDYSGVRIYTTTQEQPFVAGMYTLGASEFTVPKGNPSYPVDASCDFDMEQSIFPFAYRPHSHSLGKVITGYLYNGSYHEIGKGNPKWPQSFFPVQNKIEVKPGDSLVARCTYDSTSMDHDVRVGPTGKDEMCNFFIMFYTDKSVVNPFGACWRNNKPQLTGNNFPSDVSVPLPPNPQLEEDAKISQYLAPAAETVSLEARGLNTTWTMDLLMKGARPTEPDAYLCAAYPVTADEAFIYKFEALAEASTAHHILVYGCDGEAYSDKPFWQCPAICKSYKSTIMFAWAKNAPATVFPEDVGLRIGQRSPIKTIVLQVHYGKSFPEGAKPDTSGIRAYITDKKQPFAAGIYLMGAGDFTIPRGNPSYPVDISCDFDMERSIVPFAYRPHAHSLGKVITGYLYNGSYIEIGKGNPRWPQSFYPVQQKIEIKPGDSLAARCTYDSTSMDHDVSVGSTGKDEMCNFYIMFYTDKSVENPSGSCWGNNKPELAGINFPSDVSVPLPPNPQLEEDAKGTPHPTSSSSSEAVKPEPQSLNTTTWTMDLLMKGAKPDKPDSYLCAAYPVTDKEAYIYKFEALAEASTVHHILVYGCDGEAYSDKPVWRCPAMCKSYKSTILFAWAKNAQPTVFPKDVGLRIGQRSPIKTIVLQVHYGNSFPEGAAPDSSGIRAYITQKKQPYVAGIYFLGSGLFSIPPGQSSYPVDVSCHFSMQQSIFPFAYRTHAHGLGKVITGYQHNGSYHMIGKGNPQWPQAFYPVKEKIEVKPGDSLAARCTYDSTSMTHTVSVGSTGNDEMCNFYIMFYTDRSVKEPSGECNSNTLRSLTGDNFPGDVSEPLPPNPELEEAAKGHHHSDHGDSDSETKPTQPTDDVRTQDLLMRGAKPDKPETYLCSAYPVTDVEAYILKFEAIADVSTVHHILLYGCDGEPFSSEPNWNCPPVCKFGKMSIMFAWAKNAPPTAFPQGVGMRIGQKSQITTIVLQVHYARALAADEPPDFSGVRIFTTKQKQPFVAGIYLMASNSFTIPPGNPSYPVDISCKFTRQKSIFPFMYRAHAHSLGKVITGYQYNGSYHEIGKGNPNWPQAFYPVTDKIEVKPGDYLAARCTYDSTSVGHKVSVGSRGDDEMCNLYIMFYTDSSEANPYGECVSNSRPQLTGSNFPSDVSLPLPPNPALEEEARGHHHQMTNAPGALHQNDIHFEHKLEFNSSWPSEKVAVGQIGGVATDKDGNVYIFHRGSRQWNAQSFSLDNEFMDPDSPIQEDVIVVLNSQGQLLRKFGAGQYFMPHGIEVDKEGNIWLTDVALHQVFKIPHGETSPSLVLGHRFQHGSDLTSFCKPTDVAVLSSGEFFVSDGYCNGRVLKFARNGTLIRAWGERQEFAADPPPIGAFDISHSVTVSEENNLVCVADRENGRIQCFDLDGNFKHIIKHPEFGNRLFAIEQSAVQGGVLYAVNGPSFSGPTDISVQGFTLDIKTGALLETWNIPQHLHNPHDVCVHTGSQSVYVGELNPQAVWKLSRQLPTAESSTPVHVHIKKKPIFSDHTENNVEEHTTASSKKQGEAGKQVSETAQNKSSVVISKETESEKSDISPAVLIGCLLVIPVILLLIIILLVRARHSDKLKCCGRSKKRVFSLQGILGNSHKGFDPLNTEESDRDSDNEEYMAPKKIRTKT